jgi:hypothetical protein
MCAAEAQLYGHKIGKLFINTLCHPVPLHNSYAGSQSVVYQIYIHGGVVVRVNNLYSWGLRFNSEQCY